MGFYSHSYMVTANIKSYYDTIEIFLEKPLNVLIYCGKADGSPSRAEEETANNLFMTGQLHYTGGREKYVFSFVFCCHKHLISLRTYWAPAFCSAFTFPPLHFQYGIHCSYFLHIVQKELSLVEKKKKSEEVN